MMDQDIQMLRLDIRSKKKQLIAANLKLTDPEATNFWPVYDRYTADLVKINDEKYALIKKYADEWGTMSDEQALDLTKRALAVEEQVSQLRIRYIPIFTKHCRARGGHILSNRGAYKPRLISSSPRAHAGPGEVTVHRPIPDGEP
jgi:hypothetical protein